VDACDAWFINGQPLDRVAALVDDVRSRPRGGPPITFGMAAFVIARETDAEAADALAYAWEIDKRDKAEQEWITGQVDPAVAMFKTFQEFPHIGTNGGTAAGLVGSYDTVARRIEAFHAVGIELFMLQFQPFEAEMTRFAEHVIPRLRGAVPVRS
jgi:alkanesulfonate monooxygenase